MKQSARPVSRRDQLRRVDSAAGAAFALMPPEHATQRESRRHRRAPSSARVPGLSAEAYRPIQYLGSKIRALPEIVEAVRRVRANSRVLDAFTGSSVVAQALARAGHTVVATDAMAFPVVFARALLGIGRPVCTRSPENLLAALAAVPSTRARRAFAPFARAEAAALRANDPDSLLRATRTIPQIFQRAGGTPQLNALFNALQERVGESAIDIGGLVSSHYAATYFGVQQALAIDELRTRTELSFVAGQIDAWERDVLLTALLSVVSDCAFTPGKHFAQPHRVDSAKDPTFLRGRVMQDRSIDVHGVFAARARLVHDQSALAGVGHAARRVTFEELVRAPDSLGHIDVVYADPPYTAQQYSRFYHVPETIVHYVVPELQRQAAGLTSGLYPTGRYLSPFSSKRQASAAFCQLRDFAHGRNATLILSYSASASGKTGNDRMIALEDLVAICREGGTVRVVEMEHEYRQFNREQSAVTGRLDKEFLLIRERKA